MSWCLTRTLSSHVIPEMDTLCLGVSRANRRDEDCGFTSGKDVSVSVGHEVEACTANRGGSSGSTCLHYPTSDMSSLMDVPSPMDVSRVWSVPGPNVVPVCPLRWSHAAPPEVVNPQR